MRIFPFPLVSLALLLICSGCGSRRAHIHPTLYQKERAKIVACQKPEQNVVCPPEASKNPKTMSLAELLIAKEYATAIDNKEQCITYLEHIIPLATDPEQLKLFRLELADLYFETGKIEQASKTYATYLLLYPGSEHRSYVHYQAILCRFYMTLSADRDQTFTEETIGLIDDYLLKARDGNQMYAQYADDVQSLNQQCIHKQYEHALGICNFYIKKGSYKAAQGRLAQLRSEFLPKLAAIEPELLQTEIELATQMGNAELAETKREELRIKYPEQAPMLLAYNTPHSYVTVF
jgi:outer membrane assembly lipoprotein YfiO